MVSLQTLKSRDGKLLVHGRIVEWYSHDTFSFVPSGMKLSDAWWCKLDYWELEEGPPLIQKILVLRR